MNTLKTLNIHGIIHSFISSKTILDDILCKYFSEKAYFGFFPLHYPIRDLRRSLGLLLTWIAMPSFFIVYNTLSHLTVLYILASGVL